MSSRLVSLLSSAPFKKPGPSADFEKVKGGCYLKEILILNSFSFEDKGKRFTRLKPGLALMLLSKGLFYIRDMAGSKEKKIEFDFFEATFEGGFFNFLWAFFFF